MSTTAAQNTAAAKNRLAEVFSQIENILTDVQPAYLNRTINRIHEEVEIKDQDDLMCLIGSILSLFVSGRRSDSQEDKSISSVQVESYADIITGLVDVLPAFKDENGKPAFRHLLLTALQSVFQTRIGHMAQTEKLSPTHYGQIVDDVESLVSLVGFLYVRKFFSAAVISLVVEMVLRTRDGQPEESLVLCICDLIRHVGPVLDADAKGSKKLSKLFGFLVQTADHKMYSGEVQEAVTALNNARVQQWPSKYESQMLLKFEDATIEEAVSRWTALKEENKLAVAQMKMHAREISESASHAVHVTNMISGCTMAVIFYADSECKEKVLKQDIAEATSMNLGRISVFKADDTPL